MVELLADLNEEQKRAVTHREGALLIVAGAGTGKTTVITRRIARLLTVGNQESEEGARAPLKPDEVLALTFTDKAAQEMEDRVGALLPLGYSDLWISTFHAFAERILRRHGADAGLSEDFRILTPTECWWLMKKNADRFALDYYRPRGNPTKFFHALLKHFSRAKDEGVGALRYQDYADDRRLDTDTTIASGESARVAEIASAYRIYEEILAEENALDFGDLLLKLRDLFLSRPAVAAFYQQQFRAILVDEFQDTNAVQYELVKLLALPAGESDEGNRSLTVVADDDQAIYRWRGASFNNVIAFTRDYPDGNVVVLKKNYRSCQNILDCAYRFIQHNNPHRLEAALTKGAASGLGGISKELTASHDHAGLVEHLHATTEEQEARLVVERMAALKAADPTLAWSDIALLVRSNADADPFLLAMASAEIPHRFGSARGLYKKPFILDLVSGLRVMDDVLFAPALWRLLNAAFVRLPDRDRAVLLIRVSRRGDVALFDLVKIAVSDPALSAEGRQALQNLINWIEAGARDARTNPVGQVLLKFLESTGVLATLGRAPTAEAMAHLADLRQFYSAIDHFTRRTDDPSLHAFLEYLNLCLASGDEGGVSAESLDGPDAVTVFTVHSAKGLEFRYVFIGHLVDRRFPTQERADQLEFPLALKAELEQGDGDFHLREERRLFYVAMTRARDGLFFTSAEDYGGARKKKLSRFLFEAGIATPDAPPRPTGRTRFDGGMRNNELGIMVDRIPSGMDSKSIIHNSKFLIPDTFSYTQLKTYETCPLQYKFAHVLKLPRRGNWTLSFGQTMHRTLEKFFSLARTGKQDPLFRNASESDSGKLPITHYPPKEDPPLEDQLPPMRVPSLATLLELYEQYWIPEWYSSKAQHDEYRARGRAMLDAFYARHEKDGWPNTWALEKPFFLTIGDIRLKGKIDRLDRFSPGGADARVVIVDYKTGKSPKNDRDVDRAQLLLYHIAVSTLFGQEPVELRYEFLEDQKVVSFVGSPEELAALTDSIRETVGNIRAGKFPATPSPAICGFCDFKEICEYRVL